MDFIEQYSRNNNLIESISRKIVEDTIILPCAAKQDERIKVIVDLMLQLRKLLGDACDLINQELDLNFPVGCCIQEVIDKSTISVNFTKDISLTNQVKAEVEILLTEPIQKPVGTAGTSCFGAFTLKHPQLIDPLVFSINPDTPDPLKLLSGYVETCQ